MSVGQFKLHMDGLLEVLAGSLYANPVVGLRELIQNAHDSCTRYRLSGNNPDYDPHIEITADPETGILTVSDNGDGLSAEGIEQYLTTIGRSYTRQMRGDLSLFEVEKSHELIGQFGFGFLSAFMVASEVDLQTRHFSADAVPVSWRSDGGNAYEVTEGEREEHGTTVRLCLRPEALYLLDDQILRQKVQQFANFLPVPIYVGDDDEPENDGIPPWEADDPGEAVGRFIEQQFQAEPPLAVLQLHDHIEYLDNDETIDIPLNGFLFIPHSTIASVQEFGDLQVYIRRMFITDDEQELLPGWAKFVRGVVDSPYLHPTASRETVRRDENFTIIRKALAEQLGDFLNNIQVERPRLWQRIITGHADVMTGWAVQDDQFFNEIADILTFRTSQGRMTLPDYLKLTDNRFYTVSREIKSLQEKMLAAGNSAPVIECVWFAVRPFLEKYAERDGNISIIALDEDTTHLLEPVNHAPYSDLLATCERLGISANVARFEPIEVPALMIYPQDSEFWIETQDALDNDELDPGIAGLVESYMAEQEASINPSGTLCFNAGNAFLNKVSDLPDDTQATVVILLHQIARLFSGRTMTATHAIDAFDDLTASLETLL